MKLKADKARVTAGELLGAVERIEARRRAEARRREGTLLLGDALRELGLDMTPEEVLAAVEQRRQERQTRRLRAWAVAGGVALLFWWLTVFGSRRSVPPPISPPAASARPARLAPSLRARWKYLLRRLSRPTGRRLPATSRTSGGRVW